VKYKGSYKNEGPNHTNPCHQRPIAPHYLKGLKCDFDGNAPWDSDGVLKLSQLFPRSHSEFLKAYFLFQKINECGIINI